MSSDKYLHKIVKNKNFKQAILVNPKQHNNQIKPIELKYSYHSSKNLWVKMEETPMLDLSVHEGLLYVGKMYVPSDIKKEIAKEKDLWRNSTPPISLDLFVALGGWEVHLYLGLLNSGLYE